MSFVIPSPTPESFAKAMWSGLGARVGPLGRLGVEPRQGFRVKGFEIGCDLRPFVPLADGSLGSVFGPRRSFRDRGTGVRLRTPATRPEERVFKKSKLLGFPGFSGRSGSEKGQKSSLGHLDRWTLAEIGTILDGRRYTSRDRTMNLYITNTAYAAETLINVIVHEEEELAGLRTEYVATQRQLLHLHQGIEFLALNPDLDDEGLGQLKRAEAWGVDNRARDLQAKIQDLTRSISDKEFSTTALCG